jgi:glutathione S-transferase
MKLYYGATSSFSQKVRAAAIECDVADRIELILTKTMNHDPALARHNPLVKVPALITDDGFALFDSPVICEYLDSLRSDHPLIPPAGPDRWRVLRRQALGDGLMESLIFIGVPARRPDGEGTATPLIERQREKVEQTLDALENETGEMEREGASIGCLAVACGLNWLNFRFPDWDWRKTRPRLAAWYDVFAQRPSMTETRLTRP